LNVSGMSRSLSGAVCMLHMSVVRTSASISGPRSAWAQGAPSSDAASG
jgi:hypothetical protein